MHAWYELDVVLEATTPSLSRGMHISRPSESANLDASASRPSILQRLYRSSRRVAVELLHGSNSGSLVLKVHSWDMEGGFNERTIVRLDHTKARESEVQQSIAMQLEHIGKNAHSSAAAVVKPAEYVGQWSGIVFEDQRA